MLAQDLKDYKFSDIKKRLSEIDSQLAQFEQEKMEGANDNVYTMMPEVKHKSDGDFMESIESRSEVMKQKEEERRDLEKEMEMLQLEKQRRLVKHHEIVEKKKRK